MKNVASIPLEDAAQGLRVRAAKNGLGVSNWLIEQIEGMRCREGEIDYHELEGMGFNVKLFVDSERTAVQELFKILPVDQTTIDLVLPEEVRNRKVDDPGSETS